jgi:hypothetical protein
MKKVSLVLAGLVVIGLLAAAAPSFAASANANAGATIIQACAISQAEGQDLQFGKLVSPLADGTAKVDATSTETLVGLQALAGISPAAAQFNLTGLAGASYSISLPTSDVTITDATSDTMIVNAFTSNAGSNLDGSGLATVKVGATLTVKANQAAGLYSGPFSVAIDYN